MNTDLNLFPEFQSILKELLLEFKVPIEELDFNEVTRLLYNQEKEALKQIEDLLIKKNYIAFSKKFLEHPRINEIWKFGTIKEESDPFNEFQNELKLLWTKYNIDEELDFNYVSQKLFDRDMSILNEIKQYLIPKQFTRFEAELNENEKFKKIWQSKTPSISNDADSVFIQFKLEMVKLLQSENCQLEQSALEPFLQKLYENKDQNIADLFEDLLTPKKIKQLIVKLQSNEKLKSIWSSNMLIFSNIKSIFAGFLASNTDDIYKIISELYVDSENGMKLIESKCTNELFSKIKSNLYNDPEIRSKVFHEKSINTSNTVDANKELSSSSSNENVQNEKIQAIKQLQKIMFGNNDTYLDQLFTEISPLDYTQLETLIESEMNNTKNGSLLDIMLPYILNKLKKEIDLQEISELGIFWDETTPLYGLDYKTIFVCLIERYKSHQINFLSLVKKLGIALPFAYQWVVEEKLIWKIPLRAYSHCLAIDCPFIISLGSDSIGKSRLLNKIYCAEFVTNTAGVINGGIDVLFSTSEFACGFTIFDIHGHVCKQEQLMKVFLKMMPLENCWLLLQSTSLSEIEVMMKKLISFGVNENQIICIIRDNTDGAKQQIEKLMNKEKYQILTIRKIEENNSAFNANLATLREKLFKLTGIGRSAKKPNGHELRKENYNVYSKIEEQIHQDRYENICIDVQENSIREFSRKIDEHLTNMGTGVENLQDSLFKHIAWNKTIKTEANKKVQLIGKDTEEKQTGLTKIDQDILLLSQKKSKTKPSEIVCLYNNLLLEEKFHLINELDKRVSVWQSPILSPLFHERNNIIIELESCRTLIADLQSKNNTSTELQKHQTRKDKLEKRKVEISLLIDYKTINRDIFMRELLAIYSDNDFLEYMKSQNESRELNFNKDLYITSFIDYMIRGNELEIIDGDNNSFNSKIVSQIFRGLETRYSEMNDRPPFVVSVIGPQSTGKSTLLNMLFGSNFQTSAGRCTKGLYASIFGTKYPKAKTLLVLDTEGLLSIEKANDEYDKKLTLFSMACSQIMLINLNGEINASMKKILSISLFVANQLKVFKTRPIIIFILRNMMDLNVDKQREMIDSIKKELIEVTELSKLELNQVLDFKEEKAFFLMLSAFNKDYIYNKTEELFQRSTTNIKFAKLSQDLREKIFDEANVPEPKFKSLSDWVKQASDIWETIDLYNDMIMIESVKEINERKELGDLITMIMEKYIEPNPAKTSFRSKLEAILSEQENMTDDSLLAESNVEQRFENESELFREKVKHYFEEQVKSKSYTVKLMNEYKDRLLYAITTSKAQALQKYKVIAEKRKVKNKVQAALIDLQNRSELQILEWQKVQQDTSESEKLKKKAAIINDFKDYMNKTKDQTLTEMSKNKKTLAQWRDFVMQQIKSAAGAMAVEKMFFSVTQLDQRSSQSTSLNNIIKLINMSDTPEQNMAILRKIPILIQNKRKSSHQGNANDSAENPIYTEKQSNFLKTKWNQATSWISTFFPSETHNGKKKRNRSPSSPSHRPSNTTQNNGSPSYQYNADVTKLSEAGFSPDATVTVYTTFLEMNEYLQNSIKQEIINSAEYQITSLKQNILQIEAKKNELKQKFLEEENLEFTHMFGNELIEWLYEIIVDKMYKDEEDTYRKINEDFEKDVDALLEELKKRLDAAFGDAENAKDMATKVFNNIRNICVSKIEIDYKRDLEQATYLNADKLVELSDEVFYEKNGTFNKDGIYDYITNMIDYMKKKYLEYFQTKAAEPENACINKYNTMPQQQYENLISKLEELEKIFMNYYYDTAHIDTHKTHFTKFFKAYLEQNIDNKLIDDYLKKLNLTYHHCNKDLLEPGKLFQTISISIYSISNPKVFLTSFKNSITSLYNDSKRNRGSFKLSEETLKEKDRIKIANQQKALGCIEQCPYCGCKCTEITERHDAHHSDKHRLMAFNGSFEKLNNGKKGFVFDLCNSENTIRNSRWKENSASQLSIRDSAVVRERMNEYSVGQGDVTITLAWFDSNDLDLHVICPCGTKLYFGNKKCPTCAGYLDLDMNVCCCLGNPCANRKCSSTKPAESVYFKPAKNGIYQVSVNYFSGPKGTAGRTSRFEVRIQTHANNNIQTFAGTVEADTEKRHVKVGDYEHSSASLNFLEHIKKNFNPWSNIRPISDNKWEIVLKKAWWQVAAKMSQFYGFENNTPVQFATLRCA
ncbi:unnamed protein product [Adineta steineri]|uniref:VLIG-type G domain-containing protein n=1 Tax=Adineta steineri TaxID=433720 RepID=A0A819L8U7_9BILA|nr:unnamed protein product [Adineta steineri]CAF3956859.1 unnamed protein product [Adineta steineri]